MKKVIFIGLAIFSVLIARGQQNLSFAYDAAGNRITRTIVVSAQKLSQDAQLETALSYMDTLNGKELSIFTDRGNHRLTIALNKYDHSSNGKYTLLDNKGVLISKNKLSDRNTPVRLDDLPDGTYTLRIEINNQASSWKLVKL